MCLRVLNENTKFQNQMDVIISYYINLKHFTVTFLKWYLNNNYK